MKGWVVVGLVMAMQLSMACEVSMQDGFGELKHQNQSGYQATASVRTGLGLENHQAPSLSAALVASKNLLWQKLPASFKSHMQDMSGVLVLHQCIRDQKAWAQVWVSTDSANGAVSLKQLLQQSLQQNPKPQSSSSAANASPTE